MKTNTNPKDERGALEQFYDAFFKDDADIKRKRFANQSEVFRRKFYRKWLDIAAPAPR